MGAWSWRVRSPNFRMSVKVSCMRNKALLVLAVSVMDCLLLDKHHQSLPAIIAPITKLIVLLLMTPRRGENYALVKTGPGLILGELTSKSVRSWFRFVLSLFWLVKTELSWVLFQLQAVVSISRSVCSVNIMVIDNEIIIYVDPLCRVFERFQPSELTDDRPFETVPWTSIS